MILLYNIRFIVPNFYSFISFYLPPKSNVSFVLYYYNGPSSEVQFFAIKIYTPHDFMCVLFYWRENTFNWHIRDQANRFWWHNNNNTKIIIW